MGGYIRGDWFAEDASKSASGPHQWHRDLKTARPSWIHEMSVDVGAEANSAPHHACLAKMCCFHGRQPNPPSEGLPTSSCCSMPAKTCSWDSGAKPLSTSFASIDDNCNIKSWGGRSENSAWNNNLLTP